MIKHLVCPAVILFVLIAAAPAVRGQQPFPCGEIVAPESVGMDAEKLEAIDRAAREWVESGEIAGCSAMVIRHGKPCWYRAWGDRDLDKDLPVERDTIFRIYSMTKPVTSVAAMQLVEQGKIGLDDPLSRFVPEFADVQVQNEVGDPPTVPARREITVRDLMTHTSGLTYGFFGDTAVDREYRRRGILILDRDLEHMVGKLAEIPLLEQPGTQFHYSVSTDVLGRVVEVASEKTLAEYFDGNIFRPLGMTDTAFMIDDDRQSRLAELYVPRPGGQLEKAARWESARFRNARNRFFAGGQGLVATIDDYGRFAAMLANRGELDGQRLLRHETVEQMFTNQLDRIDQPPRGFQFGLGFRIVDRGRDGSDYSWGGAAGTRFWSNPDKNLAVVFMVQIRPASDQYGETVRRLAWQAIAD